MEIWVSILQHDGLTVCQNELKQVQSTNLFFNRVLGVTAVY